MEFVIEPKNGIWVAVKPGVKLPEYLDRIKNADVLAADIDDTIAPSPAKRIAFSKLKDIRFLASPKFMMWGFNTCLDLAVKGKAAESDAWKDFIELFLRDPAEQDKIRRQYTPEFARSTFYPGVADFYARLPRYMKKFFVTRNIREVGEAYLEAAGFNELLPEQFDKRGSLDMILLMQPEARRFLVQGDSEEDQEFLERLELKKKIGRLHQVTSIYVSGSPYSLNPAFDINIGRDYTGLVKLLQAC